MRAELGRHQVAPATVRAWIEGPAAPRPSTKSRKAREPRPELAPPRRSWCLCSRCSSSAQLRHHQVAEELRANDHQRARVVEDLGELIPPGVDLANDFLARDADLRADVRASLDRDAASVGGEVDRPVVSGGEVLRQRPLRTSLRVEQSRYPLVL